MIVIGGGSGGLSCSKEAADLGKKVAVFDFVKPSPHGTTWGLGGTCVNVGCIPKKLMHHASLIGDSMKNTKAYGWVYDENTLQLDWSTLVENVQNHIKSINYGYRVQLKQKNVQYINEYAKFIDSHTIESVDKNGKKVIRTSDKFVIAVGGRPHIPNDVPGIENVITSDDFFSLKQNPGKTLVVGASYVALEIAGILGGLKNDVTVMVRSILLRGFDKQMAEQLGKHMENNGIKFIKETTPNKIIKENGKLRVYFIINGHEESDIYDTVVYATGRNPDLSNLNLQKIGVNLDTKGRIVVNEKEQTSVSNIFAIGDVASGKPELTPVAILSGKLLAKRLYGESNTLMEYNLIPTTVYTPLEYGCIGLSEEDAIQKYGENNIEVYHSFYKPLEYYIPEKEPCYMKLICLKTENEKIVGFHITSPNAGEITQGYAAALRMGATKNDFDLTIGIHPTVAEELLTMQITKRSGKDPNKTSC